MLYGTSKWMILTIYKKKEEGIFWGAIHLEEVWARALRLETRDSSKLGHVPRYGPVRFGLVDAWLSSQGAHPSLPI